MRFTKSRGFTLLEMMVVVVVLSILAVMAMPSFKKQIDQGRASADADDLQSTLRHARSEAVKRGKFVTVCASDDGQTCGSDWTKGYILVVDAATSENASVVVAEVVHTGTFKTPPVSLDFTRDSNSADYIRFTSMGTLPRNSSMSITGNWEPDKCEDFMARTFTVSYAGNVNLTKRACAVPATDNDTNGSGDGDA